MTAINRFRLRYWSRSRVASPLVVSALVFLAAYVLGFLVRFGFSLPKEFVFALGITTPLVVAIKMGVVAVLERLKSRATSRWRYLDSGILGVSASAVLLLIFNKLVLLRFGIKVPSSVLLIDWSICLCAICFAKIALARKENSSPELPSWQQVLTFSSVFVALCLVLLYCSLGHQRNLNADWFNGDAMFPTHLVEDVLVQGNSVSGWLFPPAPFVFPDTFFALVMRFATSQAALHMFMTGVSLFLLIWISASYGVALSTLHRRTAFVLMTSAAAFIVVMLAMMTTKTYLKYLFLPAHHTGAYALAILICAAGVHLATTGEKRWAPLIGFSLLGFVAGFSDLLTIAYVSAPLTAALAIGWLLNFVSMGRVTLVNCLIWLPPLLGASCARVLLRMFDFSTFSQRSNASVAKGADRMVFGLLSELERVSPLFLLAIGWLLACGAWCFFCLYRVSRGTWRPETLPITLKRRILLLLTLSLAGLSTVGALVVGGNYTLLEASFNNSIRYLHPLIFTPLFFWPLLIPDFIFDRFERAFPRPVLAQMGIVTLVMLAGSVVYVGKGPYRLHRYVPEYVTHLDQIAEERGLTQGVAYYWTARDVNVYSKNGVRVFSVNPEIGYFDWINNLGWVSGPFDGNRVRPRPEFVVLSPRESYSRETVVGYFGEPAEEIPLRHSVAGYSVLVYDEKSQDKLALQMLKPTLEWKDGFYDQERSGADEWRWCKSLGTMKVKNLTNEIQSLQIEFECIIRSDPDGELLVESSFFSSRFAMQDHSTQVSQILRVPPGEHKIRFSSESPAFLAPNDDRTLIFQIRNFKASAVRETEF